MFFAFLEFLVKYILSVSDKYAKATRNDRGNVRVSMKVNKYPMNNDQLELSMTKFDKMLSFLYALSCLYLFLKVRVYENVFV
jgi:hypothetical protein